MSKSRAVYKHMNQDRRTIKNIRFYDLDLISLLYDDYDFINEKINWIQEYFHFSKSIVACYYDTIEEMQKNIPVKLPHWIKGVSSPDKIYILNPRSWENPSEKEEHLSKIFVHEYTHVAVFNSFLSRCPCWLNEGLAQIISEQFKEQENRNIIVPYDYYKSNYEDDNFYYQSAWMVSLLIRRFGFVVFVNHCISCFRFESDDMVGTRALQQIMSSYMGELG